MKTLLIAVLMIIGLSGCAQMQAHLEDRLQAIKEGRQNNQFPALLSTAQLQARDKAAQEAWIPVDADMQRSMDEQRLKDAQRVKEEAKWRKEQAIEAKQNALDQAEYVAEVAARERKYVKEAKAAEKQWKADAKKESNRVAKLTPKQRAAEQLEKKCALQVFSAGTPLIYVKDSMRLCKISAKMLDQVEQMQDAAGR